MVLTLTMDGGDYCRKMVRVWFVGKLKGLKKHMCIK